jgi:uncharacterized membrane protein
MTILQGLHIAAQGLHIVAAVILVGGWFRGFVALRSTTGEYDEASSLQLRRQLMRKFFPWVWISLLVLPGSGYVLLWTMYGSFTAAPLYINLMQAISWVMIALFAWQFFGPWEEFNYDMNAENWPAATANLKRIHNIILVNLWLGFIVVFIGSTGTLW